MNSVQEAMQKRYAHIHPLIFARSVEHAKDDADLFDILESIPDSYPICWDHQKHAWVKASSLVQNEAIGIQF